jgi:hypothetical protein
VRIGRQSHERGYNRMQYFLPVDHRCSFQTGPFGWKGTLDARTGIVGHGLFLTVATDLLLADAEDILHSTRHRAC